MFPTGMLRTTTQRKILRVLAEKNKRYTLEELSEMCHRSEASISRALQNAERYPFIEKERVPKTKKLTFRLDTDSQYTEPIRNFFHHEYNRERQNGTIPVEVWNLLEDVTKKLEELEGFIELFLFGSYATGEYYAGSDIDLLLAHTDIEDIDIEKETNDILEEINPDKEIQVVYTEIDEENVDKLEDKELLELIRGKAPIRSVDVTVPLSGDVSI